MVLKHYLIIAVALGVLAAILALLEGCGLFARRALSDSFVHRSHLEQGISCDACHRGQDPESVAMPTYAACFACHGESPLRDPYPYERKLWRHPASEHFVASPPTEDLLFSHALHREADLLCEACHTELDARRGPGTKPPTDVASCQACHAQHSISPRCETCHRELREDVPPPSHRSATWTREHGRLVSLDLEPAHEENCQLCHSQSDCDDCHQIEKPANHSEFFRVRSHGIQMGLDRDRCATCHKENFCVRCHLETTPRSHFSASWGGARSNHCLSCHETAADASCSVCHAAAPSHALATPIPPPPHPLGNTDCYRCHLRPPHADNRMPCTVCHR